GEAEHAVGIDGVGALRLECIGPDLVGEADAAAFLTQIEDGAVSASGDLLLRGLELLFAIALERAEDLAREALGVKPHGDGALAADVAHDKGHVLIGKAEVRLALGPISVNAH